MWLLAAILTPAVGWFLYHYSRAKPKADTSANGRVLIEKGYSLAAGAAAIGLGISLQAAAPHFQRATISGPEQYNMLRDQIRTSMNPTDRARFDAAGGNLTDTTFTRKLEDGTYSVVYVKHHRDEEYLVRAVHLKADGKVVGGKDFLDSIPFFEFNPKTGAITPNWEAENALEKEAALLEAGFSGDFAFPAHAVHAAATAAHPVTSPDGG